MWHQMLIQHSYKMLQSITIFKWNRLRKTVKSPTWWILFTSWGMKWVCLACYYRDASTSLWHINFLWFIQLCCRELIVQQGIRERSVTNELQHKWKEMTEAYFRHCPSRSMKGLRKTTKNFCYRSWHPGLIVELDITRIKVRNGTARDSVIEHINIINRTISLYISLEQSCWEMWYRWICIFILVHVRNVENNNHQWLWDPYSSSQWNKNFNWNEMGYNHYISILNEQNNPKGI